MVLQVTTRAHVPMCGKLSICKGLLLCEERKLASHKINASFRIGMLGPQLQRALTLPSSARSSARTLTRHNIRFFTLLQCGRARITQKRGLLWEEPVAEQTQCAFTGGTRRLNVKSRNKAILIALTVQCGYRTLIGEHTIIA